MSKDNALEQWLRKVASSDEMKSAKERANELPDLPEDLLARYHAGLLSPEEEAVFAEQLVLGSGNLQSLAEMQEDIESASKEVRKQRLLERAKNAFIEFVAFWQSSKQALRFAATVATAALLLYLFVPPLPPGIELDPYNSPYLGARQRGLEPGMFDQEVLPSGEMVVRVDRRWQVQQPTGDVENAQARWFIWAPLEGAESYRLRIWGHATGLVFDQSGYAAPRAKLDRKTHAQLSSGEYVWAVEPEGFSKAETVRGLGGFRIVDSD